MKVCLVSPYDYLHPGGVSDHIRHLADTLRARHHDVTVLAPSSHVGDDHGIPGYIRIGRSVPVHSNGSVARLALSFHLVRRVRNLLDTEDFDIVHYHEPLIPSLPITVLRFHRGANVGTFHAHARRNLGYYYARPFLGRYFKRLHALIAVSAPARDFVSRYFPGDYQIVPNGIDTTRFTPEVSALPELRTPGKKTLLFLGRMEQRKGFSVLLEAYALLRQHRSDIRLVVAGEGPQTQDYRRQVESYGVPDVTFCGYVPEELKPHYFASADVYCAPATGGESFGIVILEAMASGVPVVASAIPGFSQVVEHGRDGILVAPKKPQLWAEALAAILDDPELLHGMGVAGVLKARKYDWERIADSVLEVYAEAQKRSQVHLVAAGVHRQVPGMG